MSVGLDFTLIVTSCSSTEKKSVDSVYQRKQQNNRWTTYRAFQGEENMNDAMSINEKSMAIKKATELFAKLVSL